MEIGTDVPIGDEWVVNYHPYLLLIMRFDCHIHVDVVAATACVKYLFKYAHKGEKLRQSKNPRDN